jgi:Kdo2-lipid IVA lauroyltransferase/acyltransferase
MEASRANLSAEARPLPNRRNWRYRLEAAGAWLLFGVLGALPIGLASGLMGALARRIGPHLGISKRARINLRRALPELPDTEIERIVRGMWDNLGRIVGEYPHLHRIRVFTPDRRVETEGVEHVDLALAAGRPMILFSAHVANWEIGPLAAVEYGLPVALIYRAANNPFVDRMIARLRGDRRTLIPKGGRAAREAMVALRRGTHILMLVDQKMNDGIAVPFFGRPAMTAPGLAALALRFGCAVLPVRVVRQRGARFRLTVFPPLTLPSSGDVAADTAELMAAVNATVESWIRDRPEQWFWLHRRWPD